MAGDPEWFFSSLAQSSAAIVGLMGGVLGSRVVDRIASLKNTREKLDPAVNLIHSEIRNRLIWLTVMRDHLANEIRADEAAIAEGKCFRSVEKVVGWANNHQGGSPQTDVHQNLLRNRQELQLVDEVISTYRPVGVITAEAIDPLVSRLANIRPRVPSIAQVYLQELITRLQNLRSDLEKHSLVALPRSFLVTLVLLIFLSVGGVILPLGVLPGYPGGWMKPLTMVVFSLGIAGLFGFYGVQVYEMRSLSTLQWPAIPEEETTRLVADLKRRSGLS